jgi:hypothetical protein
MTPQPQDGTPIPDVVPDYARAAALPFGLAPAVVGPDRLATWITLLAVECAFLVHRHPDEQPFDPDYRGHYFRRSASVADPDGLGGVFHPDFRGGRLARLLPINGSADSLVVPRHWAFPKVPGAVDRTTDLDPLTDAQFGQFTARSAETGRIAWDGESDSAAELPIPKHADEGLLAYWAAAGPRVPGALLDAPLPGVLGDAYDPAVPLLATGTASGGTLDGELDRLLLRAPMAGSVRFQRYHHLARAGGQHLLRRPSAAGRLVVRTAPLAGLAASPLAAPRRFVFENVEASSVAGCLGPLVFDQFRRFAIAADPAELPGELPGQLGTALQLWQAVAAVAPGVATVPAAVAAALGDLVPPGSRPSATDVGKAVAVVADNDAWQPLRSFVTGVYARVLAGTAWAELHPALDLAGTSLSEAEVTGAKGQLAAFQRATEAWVCCFAGAPLGRASELWLTGGDLEVAPDATEAHARGWTTFQVEALYQARTGTGIGGDPVAGHQAARADGVVDRADLTAYAAEVLGLEPAGRLVLVRLAEPDLPVRPYTMVDWLSETLVGVTRMAFQPPLLDFGGYARRDDPLHVDHRLAALADWHLVLDGWVFRDRMNALHGAGTAARSLAWWTDSTGLADANGLWPASHMERKRIGRNEPTPLTPYHLASSVTGARTRTSSRHGNDLANKGLKDAEKKTSRDGWDDFDLAWAVKAGGYVRDARTGTPGMHPALLLALADTEGYRLFTVDNRDPTSWGEHWSAMPLKNAAFTVPGSRWQQSFMNMIGRWTWTGWPYGLDVLTKRRDQDIFPELANLGSMQAMSDQFRWVIDQLRPPSEDPARWILDPAFLSGTDIERFGVDRLATRWGTDRPQHRRLTRRLEWVGLTLQAAIFQWVHRQVHLTEGYLKQFGLDFEDYHPLVEFIDPLLPPPPPGAGSLDPARQDFLGYWSMIYLAFNTTPSLWSHWARRGEQDPARDPATRVSTHLLFGLDTSTVDTSVDEDTGNRMRILGNMTRFAAALDAYLRIDFTVARGAPDPELTGFDTADPYQRAWPGLS